MLKHRLVSGLSIGVTFLLANAFLPPAGSFLILLAITVLGQLEFYRMLDTAKIPSFRIVGTVIGVVLMCATFLVLNRPTKAECGVACNIETVIMGLGMILIFIRQFPQKNNDKPLQTEGCTILGLLYVPYMLNFVSRMAFQWPDTDVTPTVMQTGRLLTIYLIIVVKFTDIGAFFIGSIFGKHKMSPRLSPNKSWEGFFGGIAAAVLISWMFCHINGGSLGLVRLSPWDPFVLGVLLALAGIAGDLFESLLKRAAGVKDSGAAIPGMGGVLDLMDSLIFGAPVLYAYITFVAKT